MSIPIVTSKTTAVPQSLKEISDTILDALKPWDKKQTPDESPASEYGGLTYSSFGPGFNEIAHTMRFGNGAHNIRLLNRISADILLVHKSKMVGFHAKVQSGVMTTPVPRSIKNMLVKESKFVDFTSE